MPDSLHPKHRRSALIAIVGSLIWIVAIGLVWLWSWQHINTYRWQVSKHIYREIGIGHGRAFLLQTEGPMAEDRRNVDSIAADERPPLFGFSPGVKVWASLSAYLDDDPQGSDSQTKVIRTCWLSTRMILGSFPGLIELLLIQRKRRRVRNRRGGICITCGYDLRATPARCPECGNIPATQAWNRIAA